MSNTIDVTIPDIGDISDAEIIEVSVAVGDSVEVEDTLIVLETEKASMDVPSPQAGEVVAINCAEGDKVAEGAAILTLAVGAESAEQPPEEEAPAAEATAEVEEAPAPETTAPEQPAATPAVSETSEQDLVIPDLGQDDAVDVIEVMIAEGDEIIELAIGEVTHWRDHLGMTKQ